MGDLISRNDVLELLYEVKDDDTIPKNYGTILDIIRKVREIPMAFDVEKVVDEICSIPHGYYNTEVENEIVSIVEEGAK